MSRPPLYKIYQDFFDIIDTENKAYILGFLYADGYINEKTNQINLELKEDDKYILEKIRDIIYPNKDKPIMPHVVYNGTRTQYRFLIVNKHMCQQVIKHGCIQNKSHTLSFPTSVPDNLINHFIRGYFDGDGSIYISPKYSDDITFIGTYEFNNKLSNIFLSKFDIPKIHYKKVSGNICKIKIQSRYSIIDILDWLYKDATIYLERKYNKFQELKIKHSLVKPLIRKRRKEYLSTL